MFKKDGGPSISGHRGNIADNLPKTKNAQPMLPRPRRVTTMTSRIRPPPAPSSSVRHSSPKSDRSHTATELTLGDSVASAIFPTEKPSRRRSLSSGSLTSTSVTVNKTPVRPNQTDVAVLQQSTLAQWAMVYKRLCEVTNVEQQKEQDVIKQLLVNCEQTLEELRAVRHADLELTNWLRTTKALETENSLLVSLINLLRPPASLNAVDSDDSAQGPSLLDRLKQLTVDELKPSFERLPLHGFTLTKEVSEAVFPHILQFAMRSDRELQKLENLASVIDKTADQLETRTVPLAKTQAEQIIQASRLLAEETSLRFEELQRAWLRSCSPLARG